MPRLSVTPVPSSAIKVLGSADSLTWRQKGDNVVIDKLPDPLPGDYAWVFKIRVSDATEDIQRHIETE